MAEITAELLGGTRVELNNGRHQWHGDEPESNGGEDTAPTPYEMLLGSLAHCTLVTLVLYARHKGIELGPVSARYEHEKVPGRCRVHKTLQMGAEVVDEVEFTGGHSS